MNSHLPVHFFLSKSLVNEIFTLLPLSLVWKVVSSQKLRARAFLFKHFQIKQYFDVSNFDISLFFNSKKVVKEISQKDPDQLIYLDEEILLPIYTVFASGIPFINDLITMYENSELNFNGPFSATDYYFNPKVLNRNLWVVGSIYYCVEPGNYYYFVKNFKIPSEEIKTNYIKNSMPKLSEIMKKNNLNFTDFEYFIFYRDTCYFVEYFRNKAQILKLTNVGIQYISFFKRNKSFYFTYTSGGDKNLEHIGVSHNFDQIRKEKSRLRFVVKRFRFFFIKKNFIFHIYLINGVEEDMFEVVFSIEKELPQPPKIVDYTYSKDGVTINEYYNKEDNNIEPVLTVSSTKELDYFDYPLQHYRLAKCILIVYQKKNDNDILPKIYSYGALVSM